MTLLLFLTQVFIISLSGAMAPGPVAAAAITMGTRNRWAGSLLAIGHGIIEFPLMILIMLGIGELLNSKTAQISIGIIGGIVLLFMALQMFIGSKEKNDHAKNISRDRPVFTGFILSASNPYFLVWWATVGLALVTRAKGFGPAAFALFTIVHWLCDLLWVTALSFASFKGMALLGNKGQKIVLKICASVILFFGLFFISRALGL